MVRSRWIGIALLALVGFSAAVTLPRALAAPDFPVPSSYPISWELKFTHSLPKRISVDVADSPIPKAYWYMTYTVTNETDKEQRFYPHFDMLTVDGNVHLSDESIPKRVFDEIKTREHSKFLEEFTSIMGAIRLGPAEARDGVAIWPEYTPRMEHFSIFVAGLSGEAVAMKQIDGKLTKVDQAVDLYAKDDDLSHIQKDLTILRKTLQLNFLIRGDEIYPGEDEVNKQSEEWIMR